MKALLLSWADEIFVGTMIVFAVGAILQVWVWINLWWSADLRTRYTVVGGLLPDSVPRSSSRFRRSDWGFVLGAVILAAVLTWAITLGA